MKNEPNEARARRFQCYCGATFRSELELEEHQKIHPARGRAASAGGEQQADAQRPREPGQTEEERREWVQTKGPRSKGKES